MSVNTSVTEQVIEPKISLAIKQIEAFGDKYGADHLDLAMHLAFPLAITADLAYRIWGEFCQGVAWVAVSDCLLSYLWHEVDDGLYEVDVTVRRVLLHELEADERFGLGRLQELARFLLVQLQEYSQGGEVRRLHELIAWSYQDREKAAAAIVKTINSLVWSQSSLELIRIGTIINSVAVPLRAEYAELFTVSATMLQYGYGNVAGAISNINNLSDVSVLKIAGMDLLIPRFFQFETVTVNRKGEIIKREQKSARYFREVLPGGVELDMVEIPGGKFIMGSPPDEEGRSDDEGPQHEVTIQPFFMGKFPVTQAQYEAIMGENPSHFKGEKRPVDSVSWNDAVEFCEKLSKLTGRKYRLPSEIRWEYAGRAGTTTPFYFGETITGDLANYDGNYTYAEEPKGQYRGETTEVGIFPPNAFGLYDIHGNVWEWCQDTYHPDYEGAPNDGSAWIFLDEKTDKSYSGRMLRGGSWNNDPNYCRVALRNYNICANINDLIGFRVSCEDV